MEKIVAKLREEPVRARLYALVVLVAGYLVARGVISAADAEFIGAVALTVLAVETARSRVEPLSKQDRHDHP